MKKYQVDLYDFCDDQTKDALEKFCNRVNQSDADVLLIMAHKAVLLFHILLAQGHINQRAAEKIIITNFALDFDCEYLKGKKVAILDDIVISGTSIAATVNKLLSFEVRQDDIEVIAIAIDQYYFAMNFENAQGVSILHCDCKMDDASCIELSSIISKVFCYYGIPYDVDFPVYEDFSIGEETLNNLHNDLLWEVVDVSNANQRAGGVTAYTIQPKRPLRNRLWIAIGVELEDCTDLKIRLYMTRYPDGSLECQAVPMCLFNEISLDALRVLFDSLKPQVSTASLGENKSCLAQMRYLEFYIAHQLFTIFSEITALGQNHILQKQIIMQLFGIKDGEAVYCHLSVPFSRYGTPLAHIHCVQVNHSAIIQEYKDSKVYTRSCAESDNWMRSSAYEQGSWINQFIYSAFLWWYDDKEIIVRKEIKKKRLRYVTDYPIIKKNLFRLKNGLPISILRQLLKDQVPELPDNEAKNVISVFIDRAIDEGIIVPTIYYSADRQFLCRAYRHGEDLPFGEADKYRLVYFLQSIGNKIRVAGDGGSGKLPAVAGISLEKMIVLFYQLGLKQGNIFNRFLGFNNNDIIHSFLSVHGAIQGYTAFDAIHHVYSEKNSEGERYITWLTSWLYKARLVGTDPDCLDTVQLNQPISIKLEEIEGYLKENQRSTVSNTVKENIESLAELIADWYNAMAAANRKVEFRDNITALTSCANRYVYASAIATEIHYFSNYWNNQAQYALEEMRDSEWLVDRLTDREDNRRYTSIIIQGLHSGQEKFKWRNEGKAQQVIGEVKSFLGSTSVSVWTSLWRGVDKRPSQNESVDALEEQIKRAEAYLFFFSACFECLKNKDFWAKGQLPRDYTEFMKNYLELVKDTNLPEPSLFSSIENIAVIEDLKNKRDKLQQLVQEELFGSEKCVEKIENLVTELDPTYTVSYQSALILDIAALDPTRVEDAFEAFWEQLEDDDRTALNLIRFPKKLDQAPYVKYGVFFGPKKTIRPLDVETTYTENTAVKYGDFLYNSFQTLCALLNGKVLQIRGVLLPHINSGSEFRHNLQCNIGKYAEIFYKIVKPLESCYKDNWQTQLVVGLDHQVDNQFLERFSQWETSLLNQPILGAEWVTTCMVCGKDYIKLTADPADLMSRIAYSQLQINCGGKDGLGILLRLPKRVVCISCNHSFEKYSQENPAQATSAYNQNYMFELVPLTEVQQYDNSSLSAEDEILVLEPCWNGDIPFEISKLPSLEDFAERIVCGGCRCFGWNEQKQMEWFKGLSVGGPVDKGYYQIDGAKENIHSGLSGGIYVTPDSQEASQIIGIHEGRYDKDRKALMIPCSSIKAALKKVEERSTENGERA